MLESQLENFNVSAQIIFITLLLTLYLLILYKTPHIKTSFKVYFNIIFIIL